MLGTKSVTSPIRMVQHRRRDANVTLDTPVVQISKDTRCRATDVAVAEWHGVEAESCIPFPSERTSLAITRWVAYSSHQEPIEGVLGDDDERARR